MEFKRLKYFIAVAEELNFGRAAVRLGMAQPPLSRQIAALEDQLGVKLFDRSRNQIRLTDAGAAFLQRARDILRDLDSAYREARLIGQGGAGQLRIAFVGSATHGPLPGLIQAYRSKYKNVDLSLSSMNNADLERALIRRDIDIEQRKKIDQIIRLADEKTLLRAKWDLVCIEISSGKPKRMPQEFIEKYHQLLTFQ